MSPLLLEILKNQSPKRKRRGTFFRELNMADLFTIRCRENGPLVVPTNVKIVDHLGKEFPLPQGKDVIALCRCGHSANKPFCDGKHREVGFQGSAVAPK